ncbi:hypothetical protein MMC25_003753 [Agyrium rufum]|nr:hypothetical protein [Agyrium rufum]
MPQSTRQARSSAPCTESRKQANGTTVSNTKGSRLDSQASISDLFASSKYKDGPTESPTKRQKHNHPSTPPREVTPLTPEVITPSRMYSFHNSNGINNGGFGGGLVTNGLPTNGMFMKKVNGANRGPQFAPHTGAKKLVVKNLKTGTKTSPEAYANQIWTQVDAALSAIFSGDSSPYSYEELYKGVENVCRQDRAPAMYRKLCEKCKDNVIRNLRDPLRETSSLSTEAFLEEVAGKWTTWKSQTLTILRIFYYMDRSYLLQSSTDPQIQELGIMQFRMYVFSDPQLQTAIMQAMCNLIEGDRLGKNDAAQNDLLKRTFSMFHKIGVYAKFIEPQYLEQSKSYLSDWKQDQNNIDDLAVYVHAVNQLVAMEIKRSGELGLEGSTVRDLTKLLEQYLLQERVDELVDTTLFAPLLVNDERESLHLLYLLLQRNQLAERLRPAFEAYIVKAGSEIVFDEKREGEMVTRLLLFKRKLDNIWESAFQRHEGLGHSLREAFESFINKTKTGSAWGTDNPKPGEMIAKYVDAILRGGSKAIPKPGQNLEDAENDDDEVEDEDAAISKELDQVLDMFRFVHGKAVFEAFYKKDLARRLLMGRSASSDAEKSMLTRLRSECGSNFTHNLEQMFTDIGLAREEISSYKQMLEDRNKKPAVDLNVNVLSSAAWPTYPDVAVEIPQDIQKATQDFEKHYKAKHTGRRLTWKHALAHCQLKACFSKGFKEIVVSSFQAIVLLYFNDKSTAQQIGYKEIQAATNLSDAELTRTLQSLACARYRVLSKTPRGRDINPDTDTFSFNAGFWDAKYRIKINQIQLKETAAENKETHERVAADRHFETQAAIVRIMKGAKKMSHSGLIAEVIKATKSRGVLQPNEIKKEIEKLIEKDYIERGDDGGYSYLA